VFDKQLFDWINKLEPRYLGTQLFVYVEPQPGLEVVSSSDSKAPKDAHKSNVADTPESHHQVYFIKEFASFPSWEQRVASYQKIPASRRLSIQDILKDLNLVTQKVHDEADLSSSSSSDDEDKTNAKMTTQSLEASIPEHTLVDDGLLWRVLDFHFRWIDLLQIVSPSFDDINAIVAINTNNGTRRFEGRTKTIAIGCDPIQNRIQSTSDLQTYFESDLHTGQLTELALSKTFYTLFQTKLDDDDENK
jgi:hypothetical protein